MLKKHLKFFLFLIFIQINFVFDLNLNASLINNLTFYEKKIVVCDKLAQMKTSKEGGKFRDRILKLFGSVTYANKRIIYDRLIENCIKKINDSFTEKLFDDLLYNEKIHIKQKPFEELLDLEKIYKIKPKFFNKIRKNITNVLNKLYHPKKNKNKNKEIEELNELKEIFILDYIFYYNEKEMLLILFLVAILLFLIIIIIINLDSLYNEKIPKKNINTKNKPIKKDNKKIISKEKDVKKKEENKKENNDKKIEKNNDNENKKEEKNKKEKEIIEEGKKENEKKDENNNKIEEEKERKEEEKKITKQEKNKTGKKNKTRKKRKNS